MTQPYPAEAVDEIRKWVRHSLLRQYGEDGHVLPENMELSEHLAALLDYVEGMSFAPHGLSFAHRVSLLGIPKRSLPPVPDREG